MEPGVRKGKCSLLALVACIHVWSMETTRNCVKVMLGIRVMKLAESLIGWEVTEMIKGRMSFNIRERDTSYC